MHIGFDFDNTIVSYDTLFHTVAMEQRVIDHSVMKNKLAVRDFLRAQDQEHIWTELQGYVYGKRMQEAAIYPGVLEVMQTIKNNGHTLCIISHKTRYPYLGEKYDLHLAASNWIKHYLQENDQTLIEHQHIFFELTKEEKLARIAQLHCDFFIDDLPEILLSTQFPKQTKRILFDPDAHHTDFNHPDIQRINSWQSLATIIPS